MRFSYLLIILLIVSSCGSSNISDKFDLVIPDQSKILDTNHNLFTSDWSVSWLVEITASTQDIELRYVPENFKELKFSNNPEMKNYYYRTEIFPKLFSASNFDGEGMKIFIGGPNGNSFIAISSDRAQVIYYRFKT